MSVSQRASFHYCPALSWDSLGHHALTCKQGGDVVTHHNRLWDVFVESCRRACVGVQVEVGSGYGLHEQVEVGSGYGLHEQVEVGSGYGLHEHSKRPADVLAANGCWASRLHSTSLSHHC